MQQPKKEKKEEKVDMIFTSKGDLTGTGQVTQTKCMRVFTVKVANMSVVYSLLYLCSYFLTTLTSCGSVLLRAVRQQAEGLGRFDSHGPD